MARNLVVQLVDDIDGSQASETVSFGLDGSNYEIDLNERNAAALRAAVREFIAKGRKSTSQKARTRPERTFDLPALRQWAKDNDIALPPRGRIPRAIVAQYEAQKSA